jgi:SAM-dependent methyltransferase
LTDDIFAAWLTALEARHLADLRVPEVTRALRALSAAYVERRRSSAAGSPRPGRAGRQPVHGALDSAGKRAAFALFYAPLHFITVTHAVRALGADAVAPATILDLGCGTGTAGAAWAVAAGRSSALVGIERHPWAAEEARWTYRQLGLTGQVRRGDLTRVPRVREPAAIIAAWVLNELADAVRARVEQQLIDATGRGTRVLVLEPIARSAVPWWEPTAARVQAAGGRADIWRFPVDLPPLIQMFDKAAGLDHRELTVRTLYIGGR